MDRISETEQRRAVMVLMGVLLVVVITVFFWLIGQRYLDKQHEETVSREVLLNSVGMQFVSIPAGSFLMGENEPGLGPVRHVSVAPFYMGATEVTQAQFEAVLGFNPSEFKDPRHPVEQVTWLETQTFLEELNRREGTNKYRLPTEAEWEYAARAESKGRYFFGGDASLLSRYAWFGQQKGPRPVKSKSPNPWGLYDIYGNVWEWVQDCWHDNYQGAPGNSRVWGGGDCSKRVLRGGGWRNQADYLGSAVRGSYASNFEDVSNGFRVVLSP